MGNEEFRRGAEPAMRAMPTEGVYEFVARISAERTGGWTRARGQAASRCHRRQHSSYFPSSFARTVSAWLWVVRGHARMRVHVPLDVTLAQSSSIARQLAATGASRGSSRSSSKEGPLVAQHPRGRGKHTFSYILFHTSLRSIFPRPFASPP